MGSELSQEPVQKMRTARRMAVAAEAVPMVLEPRHLPKVRKTIDEEKRIRTAMDHSFVFAALEEEAREKIVAVLAEHKAKKGEVVIQEGHEVEEVLDGFFILERGSLDVYQRKTASAAERFYNSNGRWVHTYDHPGDTFGELALLHNAPRAATVIAGEDCTLWFLGRDAFNVLVKSALRGAREHTEMMLAKIDFLRDMQPELISLLVDGMLQRSLKDGEVVCVEGEAGSEMFVVTRGRLEATVGGQVVRKYMTGMYFGELVLLKGSPGVRAATVRAKGPATVMALDRRSFHRLVGEAEPFLLKKADRYANEKAPKTVRRARFEENPVTMTIDRHEKHSHSHG